jgi:hypothetical protein
MAKLAFIVLIWIVCGIGVKKCAEWLDEAEPQNNFPLHLLMWACIVIAILVPFL